MHTSPRVLKPSSHRLIGFARTRREGVCGHKASARTHSGCANQRTGAHHQFSAFGDFVCVRYESNIAVTWAQQVGEEGRVVCIALGDGNRRRAPTKEPRSLCILRPSGDRAYLTPSSSLRRTTHDKRWIAVTVAKSPARMKRTRLVELDTPARPFPQPYDLAAYPRLYSQGRHKGVVRTSS